MARTPHPPAVLEITSVLHALSDPVRLDLVRQLRTSGTPIACGKFDSAVAKSTLSHHFKILREAGIITTHRVGGNAFNELRTAELDAAFPGLIEAIFTKDPQTRTGCVPPQTAPELAPSR